MQKLQVSPLTTGTVPSIDNSIPPSSSAIVIANVPWPTTSLIPETSKTVSIWNGSPIGGRVVVVVVVSGLVVEVVDVVVTVPELTLSAPPHAVTNNAKTRMRPTFITPPLSF
jgi:hypothetical protein